jgi:hypothetical protein
MEMEYITPHEMNIFFFYGLYPLQTSVEIEELYRSSFLVSLQASLYYLGRNTLANLLWKSCSKH